MKKERVDNAGGLGMGRKNARPRNSSGFGHDWDPLVNEAGAAWGRNDIYKKDMGWAEPETLWKLWSSFRAHSCKGGK